jgi:hypothetical protein
MDPWLEGEEVFPDLHDSLIFLLKEAVNAALPPGYVRTSKNRVWVDDELRREPDVALFGRDRVRNGNGGGTAVALGRAGRDRSATRPPSRSKSRTWNSCPPKGRRLVTAVEVVSLANKRAGSDGRKAYQEKQREYAAGGVHLVEIDLLRRGPHVTATPLGELHKRLGAFDYHVSVVVGGAVPSHSPPGSSSPTGCRRSRSRWTRACRRWWSICNRCSTAVTTAASIRHSSATASRPTRR